MWGDEDNEVDFDFWGDDEEIRRDRELQEARRQREEARIREESKRVVEPRRTYGYDDFRGF